LLDIDEEVERSQLDRLNELKRRRSDKDVSRSLDDLRQACKKGDNVMPYCIEAVKNLATEQEICDIYREVYGVYQDPGLF
jgi:methylmalonyl-CoA mutase N-terminal domain/subunit